MNANTESSFMVGPVDFSFVRGGPFYRVKQALGLSSSQMGSDPFALGSML
jgi:hypothetical protein